MSLTPAQNAIIKADIAANADMNTLANNSDGSYEIARLYNLQASPAFNVWRTNTPTKDIFDTIDWTKYTPTDAPEATGIYTARALAINVKQMNLQNMTVGKDTIDTSKANIRAGLRDAVIQLPSGTSGALTAAGGASGATTLAACIRTATRLEKLLSTGSATTGSTTANLLGFEGNVSYQDIDTARA